MVVRIVTAVLVIVIMSVAGLAWALRQPNFGSIAWRDALHADSAALEAHVRFLTSAEPPRSFMHPAGLELAAAYIADGLRRSGARVSEQPYSDGALRTRNLIATFGPDTGPRIVVGAHYDVFGELPGADDNASGVAGLLELARLLGGQSLASPVELVAYSTEEPPFFATQSMGSAVHAASLARMGVRVRAMISLEMIGYYSPSQLDRSALFSLLYPRDGRFVALVGRWADRDLVRLAKQCFRGATQVKAVSYSGPVAVGADLSDHLNYWAHGFPAFMVTDTAFLRNPNYHDVGDTADTLDYRRMAGVVDGVLNTVLHLAGGEP
jgi:Zn-dependent M28 family amino/carboxypeptidase